VQLLACSQALLTLLLLCVVVYWCFFHTNHESITAAPQQCLKP